MIFFLLIFFNKLSISISGAWALYPLMVEWTSEYKKINPQIEFSVQAGGAGKGMVDLLSGIVDIAMVSREVTKEEEEKGAYKIPVCKDATLPIFSSKNPFKKDLEKRGIKKEELFKIFRSIIKNWNEILGGKENFKINVYTRSDSCGAGEVFASFLGLKQEDLKGIGIYGDPQIVEAVGRDPYGIGYANIAFIYDQKTGKPHKNISVFPIDLNENGKIDGDEDFFKEKNYILNAISLKKLPSPPARNLYLVVKKGSLKESTKEFIKWILIDGQKMVEKAGYVKIEGLGEINF